MDFDDGTSEKGMVFPDPEEGVAIRVKTDESEMERQRRHRTSLRFRVTPLRFQPSLQPDRARGLTQEQAEAARFEDATAKAIRRSLVGHTVASTPRQALPPSDDRPCQSMTGYECITCGSFFATQQGLGGHRHTGSCPSLGRSMNAKRIYSGLTVAQLRSECRLRGIRCHRRRGDPRLVKDEMIKSLVVYDRGTKTPELPARGPPKRRKKVGDGRKAIVYMRVGEDRDTVEGMIILSSVAEDLSIESKMEETQTVPRHLARNEVQLNESDDNDDSDDDSDDDDDEGTPLALLVQQRARAQSNQEVQAPMMQVSMGPAEQEQEQEHEREQDAHSPERASLRSRATPARFEPSLRPDRERLAQERADAAVWDPLGLLQKRIRVLWPKPYQGWHEGFVESYGMRGYKVLYPPDGGGEGPGTWEIHHAKAFEYQGGVVVPRYRICR